MTQTEIKIPEDLRKAGSTKAMNLHLRCTQQPRWRGSCWMPWSLNTMNQAKEQLFLSSQACCTSQLPKSAVCLWPDLNIQMSHKFQKADVQLWQW